MSAVPEVRDGVQLDLFGEVEQALAVAEQQQDATATLRGQWEALVRYWPDGTPVTWTAPWDCADGTPEGSVVPAYRCPLCGQVAGSEFLLGNDHGMGLDDWSRRASDASGCWEPRTHCTRLSLLDSQQSSLWSRTVCRGMRCSTCGRRNADPERRWHRLAGDADGEHCDCPCHDHTACQTADRCIPLIEAAGARYLAHAQAHEIPRGRWQCGSEVLIDGTRVRVVGISYPASVEHTVHYTARPIGRTDEITHWLETWQARKWVPNVAVQPAPKAPKSTRKPRPVVIDIERFGDDWRDLYRVGPAYGSRRGAERAGREMVSPGRRLSPGVEPGFLLAMVDAGVLLAVLNAAGEPVSWAGRYWAEFAQGCGWTLPEESRC